MSINNTTEFRQDNTIMNETALTQTEIQNQPMNRLGMNPQTKNSYSSRKESHMNNSPYWMKVIRHHFRTYGKYQNPIRKISAARFIFDSIEQRGLNAWHSIDDLYLNTKNIMSSFKSKNYLTEWDAFCNNKKSLIDADARLKKIIGDLDIKYNPRLRPMYCAIEKQSINGKIFIKLCTSAPKHQETTTPNTTDVKHSWLQKVQSGLRLFIGLFFGH
jgi:hypothetical protein